MASLWKRSLAFAGLTLLSASAIATTVQPTGVTTLATRADFAVRARVDAVDDRAGERANAARPYTEVRLTTLEAVAGTAPKTVALRILGGRLGDRLMTMHGAPAFFPGEEVFVFVRDNGKAASPVMALGYGVFRIERTSTGARVLRDDGTPVTSLEATATPLAACASCESGAAPHAHVTASSSLAEAMTPEAFAAGIRGIAERESNPPQLER